MKAGKKKTVGSEARTNPATRRSRAWTPRPRRRLLSVLVAQALSVPLAAQAASIEVTSTADDNGTGCTLREAVVTVNAGTDQGNGCAMTGDPLGTNDNVTFDASVSGATISLSNYVLLDNSVRINAGGMDTTIDTAGSSQIFRANSVDLAIYLEALTLTGGAATAASFPGDRGGAIHVTETATSGSSTLTLTNVTIANNTANQSGGGIWAFGEWTVVVNESTVSNNSAGLGGGIRVYGGSALNLYDSTITGNTATTDGGGIEARNVDTSVMLANSTVSNNTADRGAGIFSDTSPIVTLTDTVVSGNTATGTYLGHGGGIYVDDGSLTLTRSTISDNSAASDGGGINIRYSGNIALSDSTISNNTAGKEGDGGGMWVFSSNVAVNRSTISDNTVNANNYGFGSGGAVKVFGSSSIELTNSTISSNTVTYGSFSVGGGIQVFNDSTLTFVNTTVSDNSAYEGGGIFIDDGSPTLALTNTIIANSAGGGADCDTDDSPSVTAGDDNVIENDNCSTSALNSDPDLGSLADNGGSTKTHALNSGSPAIDATTADNSNCGTGTDLETDQRSAARDDGNCDIGAFEAGAIGMDLGDAPTAAQSGFASDYPTVLADDGARHEDTGLTLGDTRDAEDDGQPTGTADGDDTDGNDDEDGVTFTETPSTGNSTALTVTVSAAGELDAWVDFNQDGDWDDAGEQVFDDEPVTGMHGLTLSTPFDATEGTTYARFRVSTEGVAEPTGFADDGEVEDYQITIENGDSDNDGMPDDYEEDNGLDPNVDDADDDADGDGLTNLEEFNAGTRADTPDTDGDGIGDAFDNDPTVSSNQCGTDPATLSSLNVPDGDTLQCAAETSIEVQSGVTIQSGGRLELISLQVTFGDGFSVPTGGELSVDSRDPTLP